MRVQSILTLLLTLVPVAAGTEEVVYQPCSLVRLLANPDAFNGRAIRTSGFGVFRFEESALYLSEADARYTITENAVIVDRGETEQSAKKWDWQFVEVEGIFNSREPGSSSIFPGRIRSASVYAREERECPGAC